MSFRSSPSFALTDPLADRRYAIARTLAEAGDLAAAADVLAQALELAPGWAPGWLRLGEWREKLGATDEAASAYRRAAALDPDDTLGAGLRLAVLSGATPQAMPAGYVRSLFDDYAPRFDAALTGRLGYGTPALIAAALADEPDRRFAAAIDLGCGTGLAGAAIRHRVDRLVGVDLSEGMLRVAARKGIYDRLVAAEAVTFLDGEAEGSADLVIAADVVPYFGALDPLFVAVARVLAGGGGFVFSCERHDGEGFVLGETLRYRHSAEAIDAAAAAAGLTLLASEPAVLRQEAGAPVAGYVCRLVRTAGIVPLTPRPAGGGRLATAA